MGNILLSYIGYPVSAGKYFKKALRQLGHQVTHVGPDAGGFLPWQPDTDFTAYADRPDLCLKYGLREFPLAGVLEKTGPVDVIIQMDANFFLTGPSRVPNVVWAIDNHVRPYSEVPFDLYFGAHSWGFGSNQKNFHWLPCAYSPADHYETGCEKDFDLLFLGVVYAHRASLLNRLGEFGNVGMGMGVLGEEYNCAYNTARMGLCLSLKGDTPMRVFENAAQGLLIFCDPQPDLEQLGLKDGEHYVAFRNEDEAVERFLVLLDHPDRVERIAKAGQRALKDETYASRAETLLSYL